MKSVSALVVVVVAYLFVCCADGQACPSTGIACHPADCATQYKQCVGSTFYPVQDCAAGTRCYQGGIVATADPRCSGGVQPTNAPTKAPTKAPTTRPSTSGSNPTSAPTGAPTKTPTSPPSGSCKLSDIFSASQFATMFPNANGAARRGDAGQFSPFNYNDLITAAQSYPTFGCTGDATIRKRELAAFLAQTSHETSGWWSGQPYNWGYFFSTELCTNCDAYCRADSTYPCVGGKTYNGRGPIQLSWNYNYGQASQAIFGNKNTLLNDPGQVASNGVTAFKTALWFWMTAQSPKPSAHDVITGLWSPSANDASLGRVAGYGMVTNIINGGLECGIPTHAKVLSRNGYFNAYTSQFGVSTGGNLECNNMRPYA